MQWELLFIFLKPQSGIDFDETNGQINCSLHSDFEFFGRKTECIHSCQRKTGCMSSAAVSVFLLRAQRLPKASGQHMLGLHVVSLTRVRHQDLTITSQTHPDLSASRYLSVRLNFERSCWLVSAECIVSRFGKLRIHEGSDNGHEASQKMLLPLKAVLSERKWNKDYRGWGTQLLFTKKRKDNSFIKIYLTYHKILPFKMYSLMVFSIFKECCRHHHNLILEHYQLPFDECFWSQMGLRKYSIWA